MDPALITEWIIKSIILVLAMTAGFAYVTLLERKVLARMQVRIGPNRAGPGGVLQPIADAVKLIFKEELIPANANKLIFVAARVITVVPALIITAVIPWGTNLTLFGQPISLDLAANINVGILWILSVTSISVYGITLGGWSSNNKYAMLGGLRSTAQMISYELALGMAYVGPVLLAGSMKLNDIVNAQRTIPFIVYQPLAFGVFVAAALAEINRAPFDMPEAEQELTAGYHTEYSGMKFALFFMAEYIKMIGVSMIGSTLFLGGCQWPFPAEALGGLMGPAQLFAKTVLSLLVIIWIRATLPRIRYDRLMALGWKFAFPLALLNVAVTAVVVLLLIGG